MKTLFLIDGAFGDAKLALGNMLSECQNNWHIIKKITTKERNEGYLPFDLTNYFFDEQTWEEGTTILTPNKAEELLNTYKRSGINSRYFCYAYPRLKNKDTGSPLEDDEINIIDTKMLDYLLNDKHNDTMTGEQEYFFLIVRHQNVIRDLSLKYESNGQINVVPIFIYTDSKYIESYRSSNAMEKFDKLFNDYIEACPKGNRFPINYKGTIIFKGSDYSNAESNLRRQISSLIELVEKKNSNYFVVSGSEKYYLPEYIKQYKSKLQMALNEQDGVKGVGIAGFHKRIFFIMPFDDFFNQVFDKLKTKESEMGFEIIKADGAEYAKLTNGAKPDIAYWLKMYMCKQAIALFAANGKELIVNPNVIYEMGIMKQQGKDVKAFAPSEAKYMGKEQMFFDFRNEWRIPYEPGDLDGLVNIIIKSLNPNG
ncbi:MAG: hypothetical protein J1F33_06005 [Clostridiales bacterium]|nr:hypothetical protein [Clostridiales bacterium]